MRVIVVGTRGSALALAQTRFVVERLKESCNVPTCKPDHKRLDLFLAFPKGETT